MFLDSCFLNRLWWVSKLFTGLFSMSSISQRSSASENKWSFLLYFGEKTVHFQCGSWRRTCPLSFTLPIPFLSFCTESVAMTTQPSLTESHPPSARCCLRVFFHSTKCIFPQLSCETRVDLRRPHVLVRRRSLFVRFVSSRLQQSFVRKQQSSEHRFFINS